MGIILDDANANLPLHTPHDIVTNPKSGTSFQFDLACYADAEGTVHAISHAATLPTSRHRWWRRRCTTSRQPAAA